MTPASDTNTTRRKRLLWRATHRGIKEMDIIFGGFVRHGLDQFTPQELDLLERMIALPDQELLSWATHVAPVPPAHDGPLLRALLAYRP